MQFSSVTGGKVLLLSESAMIRAPCSLVVVRLEPVVATPVSAAMGVFISPWRKIFNEKSKKMNGITGAQIRAARALLRWTAEDLAKAASVGVTTIRRAEAGDGQPPITAANLKLIRITLEDAGIEFIARNGGGVGVRFKKPE